MTNPTTAKPTTAVYDSNLTFGANLQSMVALTEGQGSPSECKSLALGQAPVFAHTAGLFPRAGDPPTWVANGLPGFGYSLRFDHSTRALLFGNAGFTVASTNGVVAKTIAVVFKHNITSYNRTNALAQLYPLVHSGSAGATGISLYSDVTLSGTNQDKLRMVFASTNTFTDPIVPFEVVAGRWYAAAISVSTISAGKTTKTFYLYDITNQQLHPGSGLTMVDANNGAIDTQLLTLAAFGWDGQKNAFVGEFAAFSLHNETWSSGDFANYYADPIAPGRGTYSASGSMTASLGRYYDSDTSSIQTVFSRTTGIGTGGGTGAPTYTAWRAALSTIAPGDSGSTNITASLVTGTGNTLVINDTGLYPGQEVWHTIQATDGSQVKTSLAVYGRAKSKPTLVIGIVGDSKEQITTCANHTIVGAVADNRKCKMVNWSRGSAGLTANNTLLSWRIGNVIAAANQACTLSYANGSVSGGTFNLIFPFNTPITVSGIAWNTSVAALQTALDSALGGANLIVVSGAGTLDANTLTLTGGSSGAYHNTGWIMPVFDVAGSALTGASPTQAGEPVVVKTTQSVIGHPGTTADSLYTQALAEFARNGVVNVICQNSSNDTANAQWQSDLSAMLADLLSRGYRPIQRYPQTRGRSNVNLPDPAADAVQGAFIPLMQAAVAANPGAKLISPTPWSVSVQEMDVSTYSDGIHETANSTFSGVGGVQQYLELCAAFEGGSMRGGISTGSRL